MFNNELEQNPAEKPWCVYLLECVNGIYYTGITNNLEARFKAHVAGKGAKFTRANKPIRILASAQFPNKSIASKAEYQIKQKPKAKKVLFLHELAREFLGECRAQPDNDEQTNPSDEPNYDPPRQRPLS